MVINQHPFYLKKDVQLQVEYCCCLGQSRSQVDGFHIRGFWCLEPKEEPRPSDAAGVSAVMLQSHFQELRRQKGFGGGVVSLF